MVRGMNSIVLTTFPPLLERSNEKTLSCTSLKVSDIHKQLKLGGPKCPAPLINKSITSQDAVNGTRVRIKQGARVFPKFQIRTKAQAHTGLCQKIPQPLSLKLWSRISHASKTPNLFPPPDHLPIQHDHRGFMVVNKHAKNTKSKPSPPQKNSQGVCTRFDLAFK